MVDKASTASFQWLFVVVLALFLGFSYLVFRHLIRQQDESARQCHEDSVSLHKLTREDSQSYQKILLEIHMKAVERSEKTIATLAENSLALSQNKLAIEQLNLTLRKQA